MARTGRGLSDSQRSALAFIAIAAIAVNTYMAALPPEDNVPRYIIVALGAVAVVAGVAERFLGVRDATVAAVAKRVNEGYPTYREPNG